MTVSGGWDMSRAAIVTVGILAVSVVAIILVFSGAMPLALGGVHGVDCHDDWMRVTLQWVKEMEDVEDRSFAHDNSVVTSCAAWGFLRDDQVTPELEKVQVCGITVTQYFTVYNYYAAGMGGNRWITEVMRTDETGYKNYMRSKGIDDHDDCTAEAKIIFDSRECVVDGDCPPDEWVGEPYCGL